MVLAEQYRSPAPEALLRDFAAVTLGRERCGADYISALRVVLGNMARADRLHGRLKLSLETSFASIQTMRGLIKELHAAGLLDVTETSDGQGRRHRIYTYKGRGGSEVRGDRYTWVQRIQDDHDFDNYLRDLGLSTADCPY